MPCFATRVAAAVIAADNVNAKTSIPQISFWDALLPERLETRLLAAQTAPKATNKDNKTAEKDVKVVEKDNKSIERKPETGYYTVQKRKNNKRVLISHKGRAADITSNEKPEAEQKATKQADKEEVKAEEKKTGDWTTEEDGKLRALKADNKSWKQITAELGRDTGQVKQRWNAIKDAGPAGDVKVEAKIESKTQSSAWTDEQDAKLKTLHAAGTKFNEIAKELGKDVKDIAPRAKELGILGGKKGKEKTDDKKVEVKKSEADGKDNKKGKSSAKKKEESSSEVKYTYQEWRTLQADSHFSLDELRLLAGLLETPNRSWRHIAGLFFDKTGRRVDPSDIKDKFMQMAAMA